MGPREPMEAASTLAGMKGGPNARGVSREARLPLDAPLPPPSARCSVEILGCVWGVGGGSSNWDPQKGGSDKWAPIRRGRSTEIWQKSASQRSDSAEHRCNRHYLASRSRFGVSRGAGSTDARPDPGLARPGPVEIWKTSLRTSGPFSDPPTFGLFHPPFAARSYQLRPLAGHKR